MKSLPISELLDRMVAASEFKRTLQGWLRKLDDGPLIVTVYNYPAAVVLSPREYDRLIRNQKE